MLTYAGPTKQIGLWWPGPQGNRTQQSPWVNGTAEREPFCRRVVSWRGLLPLGLARGVDTCPPTRLGPRLLQSPVSGIACDVSLMTFVQPRRLSQRQVACKAPVRQALWEGVRCVPWPGLVTPVGSGGVASRPLVTVRLRWAVSWWWALCSVPFLHDDLI